MSKVARMHLDSLLDADLGTAGPRAAALEAAGYEGLWVAETNHDPFLPLALAATSTSTATIGTAIAVAFARSPMVLAHLGWDLNAHARGRLVLGLGSQVKPHIERRFSMPWSQPALRMREYVAALRSIWSAWQDGTTLDFRGDFYTHTLMTPMFSPPGNAHGAPRIFLAAVEEAMTRVAAEVADGLIVHPFTSRRYLDEVVLPAIDAGLARAGRQRTDLQILVMPIVVTGETDEELDSAAAGARRQLAFYASTPGYRRVLELHGQGDLQPVLQDLSRRGDWDAMAALIDDELLDTCAVVAKVDDLAGCLLDRFGGVADRLSANLRFSTHPDLDRVLVGGFAARPAPTLRPRAATHENG
jgi:probable F420-dependent oxidoreductase